MIAPAHVGAAGPRVLIVDDESSILESLRILLKHEGFTPFTALGGKQGIERLTELRPDIVLTDGWIRTFEDQFSELMPKIVMDGMTPETLAWFAKYPNWDPRVRLAEPSDRDFVRQQLAHQAQWASTNKSQNELPKN